MAIALLPAAAENLLTCAAAALLESVPFVLAGEALASLPRARTLAAFVGCGCGGGPSARSLPAAVTVAMTFGPTAAVLRFGVAVIIARLRKLPAHCSRTQSEPLTQLRALLPAALCGGVFACVRALLPGLHASPLVAFGIGALSGFVAAPCALGVTAIAGSLRALAAPAAFGFLSIAGICDLRAFAAIDHDRPSHDACSYLLCATACAIVAVRGGAALVNPHFTVPLAISAALLCALAWRHRKARARRPRIAALIMLAGSLSSVNPPAYHATETTLSQAFAGERLDFTGELTQSGGRMSLVRYAITCCRADASPIVVRLRRPLAQRGWIRAHGILVQTQDGLQLLPSRIETIAPPSDPFVYR